MLVQHALEEEPDAADGDGGSGPRVMLDVLEIEEVLAQFFSTGAASQVGCTALLFGLLAGGGRRDRWAWQMLTASFERTIVAG